MGVGGQRHVPAAYHQEKDPVSALQEAGWAPGPVWTGVENLVSPGLDPWAVQPVVSGYTGRANLVRN